MKREEFKVTESIKPGEDFFLYSNKYWIDNNPMPADKVRYAAFDKLHEENLERLMELVDKPCTSLSIPLQMNIINIRNKYLERDYSENLKFIQTEYLGKIDKLSSFKDALDLHASWIGKGIRFLFDISLDADLKDCDNNIIYISQDGLSINKDFYENDKVKNQLMKYIEKLMKKVTNNNFDSKLLGISKIEDRLASFSYTETQMRDVEMSYNIFSFTSLLSEYPLIPWEVAFNSLGIDVNTCGKICVRQPDFFKGLNSLIEELKNSVGSLCYYQAYLTYCVLDSFAPHIGEDYWNDYFDFYCRTLSGQEEPEPLEKRAYYATASIFPEAIGKKYIENYFGRHCKDDVENIVNVLKFTFEKRIQAQTWMSQETKDKAIEKLKTFKTKIGYPEKLEEYEWINFNMNDCYLKIKTDILEQNTKHEIEKKLGKPVDKDEWFMSPQTVNAYYNPTTNEICFPAGILQFPFYSPDAGIAWNYGAIGAVIAHEMTHGFDDQGRLFNKEGNMENWWTKEDSDKFKEITDKFVNFWNNVEALPGVKANGELSLGENLADHGGVRIALEALKRILTSKEDIREFFLAYSANWAGSIKEEEAKRRVIEDVHSLGRNRVNECLCHFDEWYEAFDINEKDKMFIPKENRLSIW